MAIPPMKMKRKIRVTNADTKSRERTLQVSLIGVTQTKVHTLVLIF